MFRFAAFVICLAGVMPASEALAAGAPVRLAQAAAIDAPSTVDPGATVAVSLSGVTPGGRVEVWGPVSSAGKGSRLASVAVGDAFATLDAPRRAGSYELRYVTPSGAVQARTVLDVSASPVMLDLPERMSAGLGARVRWRGPAAPGDMLQIVDPETGSVVSEAPAAGQPGTETETTIRAPERTGAYRLRYWSGERRAVLRALPVRVVKGKAWLRTPAQVSAGARFAVQWSGPTGAGHAFRIVDPASGSVLASQPGSDTATLTAPDRPGGYRIRYVNSETGQVLSDLPLRVGAR